MEFFLRRVKKDPGRGGINMAIVIKNPVVHLTRNVVRHDANNNGWDASSIRGSRNNILDRGRGGFRLCIVNWSVFTGSKELPSCLALVVTFSVKGVDSFNKLVDGCGLSEILEDIWGIL